MITRGLYSSMRRSLHIFGAIIERIGPYLTLCATPLDITENINMQISLDYISETQGWFIPIVGFPKWHSLYGLCMMPFY